MEKAQKDYRFARRLRTCGLLVMLLSWVLTVGLIIVGTMHMDHFSLFMVLSLLLGFCGTFFYLCAAVYLGNKATELARQILALGLPMEEMLHMAAELHLNAKYIFPQMPNHR